MKKVKSHLLKIHPGALLRTPQFSVSSELQDGWEELKVSISKASAEFYALIKDLDYDQLQQAPDQIQYTVWKYFNRAKYRATPFGSFAGVGLLDFVPEKDNKTIVVAPAQQLHQFRDWADTLKVNPIGEHLAVLKFFSNSSYYGCQDSIRYLSRFNNEHQVSEIETNPVISELLKLCKIPTSYRTITKALQGELNQKSIDELLKDLVEMQLLLTSRCPNIIGEDYFKRVQPDDGTSSKDYIIAERKVIKGGLRATPFRYLPELIGRLNGLLTPTKVPVLNEFISEFSRRFGDEAIPIMKALDPELGVGYGHLEQLSTEKDLLFSSSIERSSRPDALKNLKSNLLNEILANQPHCPAEISLEDLLSENSHLADSLPNSITALVSIADDRLQIESTGGVTANAILGRFSICGDHYTELCREIADLEQKANPEVLFFDIGCAAEPSVDNINRRASIYDLQLNLLNYDTSANPLTLDDISVLVRGNELLLYSHKFKKRLVPRMSSAYNYSRSDLAVFRLLCDLQHQGLQTDFNLDLHDLYPGLPQYPRLTFKNIILSPASWKINLEDLRDNVDCFGLLKEYLEKLGVSKVFKVGETDQTLYFDRLNEADMQAFSHHLKKQKRFYVKEAWTNGFTQDEFGRSYHNQVVLTMTHQEKLYDELHFDTETLHSPQQTGCFPPGSKWLYFQIYCHPGRADDLLLEVVRPLLLEFGKLIEKWFFIRYDEKGHHIRLRLCLKDTKMGMQLTSHLSVMLEPYFASEILSDFSLCTYKQEIQRYGADHIEQVEAHFCADSNLVIGLIPIALDTFGKYQYCVHILDVVKSSGVFSLKEFDELIQSISDSLNSEFRLVPLDYRRLNTTYKEFQQFSFPPLPSQQAKLFGLYCQSLQHTLQTCAVKHRDQLFSDLMHMHINRLFSDQQRKHELIVYYLFSRFLKTEALKNTTFSIED